MVELTENLRPKVTGVSIRGERSSHAVAPPGARGTVPDFHLHAHLAKVNVKRCPPSSSSLYEKMKT